MDIQSIISSGLQDIVTVLVGALVAYLVAYVKQHFSAKQISTAMWIASEAVDFAAQAAKKLGITEDSAKFNAALTKAKELAVKAGLNYTDSQWETLLESAYKKTKNELQPFQAIASSTAPYTQDEIINLIKVEVQKAAPNVPVDTIANIVEPLVQKQLSKLSISVNVSPDTQSVQDASTTAAQPDPQPAPTTGQDQASTTPETQEQSA